MMGRALRRSCRSNERCRVEDAMIWYAVCIHVDMIPCLNIQQMHEQYRKENRYIT